MIRPVASSQSTIEALLKRSRRQFVPIRRAFVQRSSLRRPQAGPLAQFVHSRDARGLELYLLFLAVTSAEPWRVCESAKLWARTLDLPAPAAVSKIWKRLEGRTLISRMRSSKYAAITALREDGSGQPYIHPGTVREPYLKLPFEYWTAVHAWHRTLSLPETAMLLISLSLLDNFVLPYEKAKQWYGISADTAERGLRGLQDKGLLWMRKEFKEAPLSPEGYTEQRLYTLRPPFGPRMRRSTDAAERPEALSLKGGLVAIN